MSDTGTSPSVTLTDTVRVVNYDDRPARTKWLWDMRDHTPRPMTNGTPTESFMPFECMKLYCGDPRSAESQQSIKNEKGETQFIPDRPSECKRIAQLWQDPNGFFHEFVPGDRESFAHLPERCPKVQVFTLTGERIFTVLDDPVGDFYIPAAPPSRFESVQKDNAIQALTIQNSRNERVIALLAQKLGIDPADLDASTAPESPSPVAGTHPVVEEDPLMKLDPRTDKISKHEPLPAEPTTLEDTPESL